MNENLKKWLPWIAVAAVAVIVIAVIAFSGDSGDEEAATTTTVAETTTTTVAETTTTTVAETTTTTEAVPEFNAIPVKIGTLLPQTGGLASIIDALENPIRMGAAEINAVIPGLVTVEFGDSGTDPAVGSVTVDKYLDGTFHGILGAAASSVTTAVVDKVQGSNVVMCSGSNTGASLSAAQFNPYYTRTAPSDELQAPLLGSVVQDDGHETVVIAYRNDTYGVGFADLLEAYLTDNGADVSKIAYAPDATSFTDVADAVAASGADAFVLISFSEGGQLILDLQGKYEGAIYVADGFKDSVGADQLGGDATLLAGIRGTAPSSSPANGTAGFSDRLEAAFPGTLLIFSSHFFDCLMVEVLAAQSAQSSDPAVYVDHIISVTKDGTKCTSFGDCYDLLVAGEDIDYDGASGPLDFGPNGEPGVGTYDIFTYDAEGAAQVDAQAVAPPGS